MFLQDKSIQKSRTWDLAVAWSRWGSENSCLILQLLSPKHHILYAKLLSKTLPYLYFSYTPIIYIIMSPSGINIPSNKHHSLDGNQHVPALPILKLYLRQLDPSSWCLASAIIIMPTSEILWELGDNLCVMCSLGSAFALPELPNAYSRFQLL